MVNPTLPQELIKEILLMLPVRSLIRFKCVCKSWLSLISDSKFAKSHYDLATEPTHQYFLKSTYGSEVRSIDIEASLDDHSLVVSSHVLPHPFSRFKSDDPFYNNILIYGSCRGFLLLDYAHCDLLVWNPSTGAHTPISYPNVKFTYDSLYGFGYDASTDDYLVLLMAMHDSQYDPIDWNTHIGIFSLKNNSWDQIECCKFPYLMLAANTEAGLLLNGALHWLVCSRETYVYVIIAFDLIERSLSEIPLPHGIAMELRCQLRKFYLRVMGNCLCLCYPGSCDHAMAEIWMMKEYKVQPSWTKSFVLPTHDIPNNFFLPICFTKFEGLFGSNFRGRLVKFNSKGVLIEHGKCSDDFFTYNLLRSAMYRESLLSLPGDFAELSVDGQQ